jgi:hypothetical protein
MMGLYQLTETRLFQRVGAAGKPLPDVEIVEIKAIIVLVLV